jgi:hypothetical protein
MAAGTTGRGWAYTGALLGGAVSIAANVAHSYVPPAAAAAAGWAPQPGAVLGAVFWPVALFVAIETLARTGWPAGLRWVALRYLGLLPVAAVAALVSYRHLSGLLAFYGEDPLTVRIGPLAVDGLMVMATGALIATARTARRAAPDATTDMPADAAADVPADTGADSGADGTADVRSDNGRTPGRADSRRPRPARASGTAAGVERLRRRYPEMSSAEIARRLGVTDRTVRRHLAPTRPEPAITEHTSTEPEPAVAAPAAA